MKRKTPCYFVVVLSLSFLLGALLLPGDQLLAQKKHTPVATAQKAASAFHYNIIAGANSTFGYDIYQENRLKIHQPNIPAVPGSDGFKTKAAAEKVAQLVISKMEKGETLPTVSIAEMQKLHVLSEPLTKEPF